MFEEYDFEHVSLEERYNSMQDGDFRLKDSVLILCGSEDYFTETHVYASWFTAFKFSMH